MPSSYTVDQTQPHQDSQRRQNAGDQRPLTAVSFNERYRKLHQPLAADSASSETARVAASIKISSESPERLSNRLKRIAYPFTLIAFSWPTLRGPSETRREMSGSGQIDLRHGRQRENQLDLLVGDAAEGQVNFDDLSVLIWTQLSRPSYSETAIA